MHKHLLIVIWLYNYFKTCQMEFLLQSYLTDTVLRYFNMRGENALPDFSCSERRNSIFSRERLKPSDMIYMIVCYENTHNCLHRNVNILKKLAYGCRWNSGIYQYSMELIAQVITISAASATMTAKIQFHKFFVHWCQRYLSYDLSEILFPDLQQIVFFPITGLKFITFSYFYPSEFKRYLPTNNKHFKIHKYVSSWCK